MSNTQEGQLSMKMNKRTLKVLFISILLSIFTSVFFSSELEQAQQVELQPEADVASPKDVSFGETSSEAINEHANKEDIPQSAFEVGKRLLVENKANDALKIFTEVARREGSPFDIYLYIGLAQLKLGQYSEAIDSFARGKNIDAYNFHVYSFNMGNAFFAQNKFYDAEISYNEALSSGKAYPKAILNRANARMKIGKYRLALVDYKAYLQASPNDAQEEEVKLMIAALENAKLEDEVRQDALLQEATRRAEQAMREAEAERQRKLLEEINSSLSSVEDSDSLSSGTEDTINYEEENDLD